MEIFEACTEWYVMNFVQFLGRFKFSKRNGPVCVAYIYRYVTFGYLYIGMLKVGVGTATNFRTAVYHGTEVRTVIRTAIYRVTCNFGRDHQFAPKYKGHT